MKKTFTPGRGYTKQDWDEVSDHPELNVAELQAARPFAEIFPDIASAIRRGRGPQKAPIKIAINIRLDADIVERFKAGGPGWQKRINEALKRSG